MSSQSRSRDYELSRSSPYISKSREVDGRKRDSYASRGDGGISEKPRTAPYSSKSSRRSIDDRKDPYISSSERRDSESSRRERDNYSSTASRETYSKVGRERDYSFESRDRERDPFMSRGKSHASRGHRDSYSSHRGRDSFHPRGGRDSYGSRGSYGTRGHRDSFSSRGSFGSRESFSRGNYMSARGSKDYSRGSYGPARGGRDSFSSRGSFGSRGGRDSFSSRGNYFGSRGGRANFSRGGRGLGRGFRGSNRGLRSDPFMSQFDSRAQLKLTEKLVASVLEDSEEDFRDQKPYRVKEYKHESRSYNPRESERHYKEPSRSFSHHSSFSHGDKLIKRERSSSSTHFDKERFIYSEKSKMKMKDKFKEAPPSKRVHEDEEIEDERPPLKHMRLSKRDKYHDSISSSSHRFEDRSPSYSPARDELSSHRLFNSKEREEERVRRSRERTRKTEKERRPSELEEIKSEEREVGDDVESVKVKRKFSRDEELDEEYEEKHHRKSSPTGMQVTVRSDGERAVNSKGSVKSRISSRKLFIDLQCPHCPEERSYTFRDYKFHLVSHNHRIKLRNLLHKHSIVLRRIRQKQRNEQKEKEDKWEAENPEEFKTTVSRYCYTCKLAFKCLPEDESSEGIAEHNASKLHKVQHLYTYPRCDICGVEPPSRLAYEIHLVSIRHLRMTTMSRENRREISEEDNAHDDANVGEREELDLANFITMDSVGEDEEVGSEHEEMIGDPEDIKKAEEEAKEGGEGDDEDDEHEEHHGEEEDAEKSHHYDGEDDLELELDHEIGEDLDMSDEEREVCGKEFLVPLEAFYCKLCHKAIRVDTPLGETALDRHCTSSLHIENFHYLNSEEYAEEQRGDNFDEEHLGEEEGEETFAENEEEAEPEERVLIEESDEQGNPEGSTEEDRREIEEEDETDGDVTVNGK